MVGNDRLGQVSSNVDHCYKQQLHVATTKTTKTKPRCDMGGNFWIIVIVLRRCRLCNGVVCIAATDGGRRAGDDVQAAAGRHAGEAPGHSAGAAAVLGRGGAAVSNAVAVADGAKEEGESTHRSTTHSQLCASNLRAWCRWLRTTTPIDDRYDHHNKATGVTGKLAILAPTARPVLIDGAVAANVVHRIVKVVLSTSCSGGYSTCGADTRCSCK